MGEGWKYYNHAIIPACAPHEPADMKPLENGSVWKLRGGGKEGCRIVCKMDL